MTNPTEYTKDFKDYRQTEDNFVTNQEITVTITLHEYRSLVTAHAQSEYKIDKANSERFEKSQEITKLEKEITKLKEKILNMSGISEVEDIE